MAALIVLHARSARLMVNGKRLNPQSAHRRAPLDGDPSVLASLHNESLAFPRQDRLSDPEEKFWDPKYLGSLTEVVYKDNSEVQGTLGNSWYSPAFSSSYDFTMLPAEKFTTGILSMRAPYGSPFIKFEKFYSKQGVYNVLLFQADEVSTNPDFKSLGRAACCETINNLGVDPFEMIFQAYPGTGKSLDLKLGRGCMSEWYGKITAPPGQFAELCPEGKQSGMRKMAIPLEYDSERASTVHSEAVEEDKNREWEWAKLAAKLGRSQLNLAAYKQGLLYFKVECEDRPKDVNIHKAALLLLSKGQTLVNQCVAA